MKTISIIMMILVASILFAGQTPVPREIGNLVIEGVPDIPAGVAERIQQYENTRSAIFQDWQPDGKAILITSRFGNTDQVHSVAAPAAYRRQLTFYEEPVAEALFPPKKNANGFLFRMDVGGGEFYQLYWFDSQKGKHQLLTSGGRSRNVTPVWSNNGGRLAFCSTKRNGKDLDLYLLEKLDPKSERIIKQVRGSWQIHDWSPDDTSLLVEEFISINESHLYVHDVKTGKTKEINTPSSGKKIGYGPAAFAHHRAGIYFTSDEDGEFRQLYFYDLNSGRKTSLTSEIPWDIQSIDVSLEGKWIAYVANEGGRGSLYIASTQAGSTARKISIPQGVISRPTFDPAGRRLAFNLSRPTSPDDVYVADVATNKVERWTFSEVGGLNPDLFVEPELFEYPTFDSAKGQTRKIPAFYFRPRSRKPPFPVIIHIHGGPEAQVQANFNSLFQYWVNELGAAVIAPNVRGSNGYGKTYLLLDNAQKRMDSVKDIGKLLDWIGTRPELDAKRVGVYGASYGGFMVLSTMANYNDRLRCGVELYGISNFVTFLQSTEEYRRDLRRAEYGDERQPEMRKFLESISPTSSAKKISIPMLVLQGKNDPRVPLAESQQIVKEVRSNGGSVWYIMAKDEGHGFKKKANRDYYYNAVSLFYETFLLAGS